MTEYTVLDLYKVLSDQTYTTFSQFNSLITGANPFDSYDDIDYYLSHSSRKFLSQFIYNIMELAEITELDDMTSTEWNLIFTTIGSKYGNKWNRLYQALVTTTYEPDENYNMEEIMSDNNGTGSETITQIINQIVKNRIDQTDTDHIDQGTDDSMYAFNSSAAVPTTSSTTQTGTDGNVHTTVTNGVDGNTVETLTQGDGNVQTKTIQQTPYKLTRHGNIGVTTNQQMITQELELRKNLFKEIVYRDVDAMLTSSVYYH